MAVRPLRLADPDEKPGYDHLDGISMWFLAGAAGGAEATGVVDDDRYGLDLVNSGAGGLSFKATSGNGSHAIKVDNTSATVTGGLTITGGGMTVASLVVLGTSSFTGAASFGGSLTVTGPATFVTNVNFSQGITVAQSAFVLGNLTVTGSGTFNANLSVQGNGDIDGTLAIGSAGSSTLATLGDWTLALSGDDLVFSDDAGQEIFRVGDNASTDHVKVTGNMHVTGNIELENDINHDGNAIGFFGSAPSTKETVTGAKAGNAALDSLLSALANYGLVTDSTT